MFNTTPTDQEVIRLLTRWVGELRYDLTVAHRNITALEGRCQRLEHAARQRALARRHWIRNGHGERV